MPYELTWIVDKRVIYFRSRGLVSVDEIKKATQEIRVMLDTGIPLVYLLTDARAVEKVSLRLRDIASIFRSHSSSPKLGWSVYVSPKPLVRLVASITSQLARIQHREYATIEEALAFLRGVDATLPEIRLPDQAESNP